jgi:hypothetical protein
LGAAIREIRSDANSRALAARLNIVAHSLMDFGVQAGRFADQVAGPDIMRSMATVVIRAQGLQRWTEAVKRAFTMEFLGHIADQAPKGWDQLDDTFRGFLERYRFTADEWDSLRKAPALEAEGATFFDLDAVEDRALGERLLGAVLDERAYAVLEPDARVQAITTGGARRGTLMGETVRSLFQFKSFSMTMIATHMMRGFAQGDVGSRPWYLASLVGAHMIAGGAAIQAKQMLAGKDPRDMADWTFWGAGLLQGGGLGIYGDYLNAALSRTGRDITSDLAGPVFGLANEASKLVFPKIRKMYEGEEVKPGAELARLIKSNTPGSSLWFARLALDRMVWDQLQMQIDPEWRKSFRRVENRAREDYGQEFWWRPGETAPRRGPELGAALEGF